MGVPAVIALLLAIGVAFVVLTPSNFEPCYFELPGIPPSDGPLAHNRLLTNAELLLRSQMKTGHLGAEAFAIHPQTGALYAGLSNGSIVELVGIDSANPSMRIVAHTGETNPRCGEESMEPRMAFHPSGSLISADSLGLLKINITTGKVEVLLNEIDGLPLRLVNVVRVAKNGMIYFSVSSTIYVRSEIVTAAFENCPSGFLGSYDMATQKGRIIVRDLCLPNGIDFDGDQSHILVVESGRYRIRKFSLLPRPDLTLNDSLDTTIFHNNIPGYGDNMVWDETAQLYWVAFTGKREGRFSMTDFIAPRPWLRKLLLKFIKPSFLVSVIPPHGLVCGFTREGKLVVTLQDPTGVVVNLSEAIKHGNFMYLGTWKMDFIARLPYQPILDHVKSATTLQ